MAQRKAIGFDFRGQGAVRQLTHLRLRHRVEFIEDLKATCGAVRTAVGQCLSYSYTCSAVYSLIPHINFWLHHSSHQETRSSCKVIPIDYNAAVALSVAHTTAGIFRHTPDPIISPSYRETERTALAASCSYGLATAVIVEYAPCTYTKNRRSLLLRILLRDVK